MKCPKCGSQDIFTIRVKTIIGYIDKGKFCYTCKHEFQPLKTD